MRTTSRPSLTNKIDFAVVFRVTDANPNGDTDTGRPRRTRDRLGEVSDVCIKRKLRDRLQEQPNNLSPVLIQSDNRSTDKYKSIKDRVEGVLGKIDPKADEKKFSADACRTWFDVRAFGQLFAFKKPDKKTGEADEQGTSVGIHGPLTIYPAYSIDPVEIVTTGITKSVNSEDSKKTKGSDRMGSKHAVKYGIYVFYGSMNTMLAAKTGFSDADAELVKEILPRLFENDASASRPDGSMEVLKVVWWDHNCPSGQVSSAKLRKSLTVKDPRTSELLVFEEGTGPIETSANKAVGRRENWPVPIIIDGF